MSDPSGRLPAVTAVVLAYGAEPYLAAAVDAVLASTGVEVDVVVVDNGCTTDAVDRVKGRPGVRIIRPDQNLGYAGGTRTGAAEATGDWLAFINSDAIVEPPALARMITVAAEPGVGLAMGSIRLADNPDQINSAGNPLHYTGLSWAGGFAEPATAHAQRRPVACGSGCGFVINTRLWHTTGGITAEYFAYCEDSELSLRLWQSGHSVEYVPDAIVKHHYEFSRNARKSYLLERNRLIMVLTTYQTHTLLILAPMLLLTEAAMLAAATAGGWARQKTAGWTWIWRHRTWIRHHRATLQRQRTVPDRNIIDLMTAEFTPANITVPGQRIFNTISRGYWAIARRLI